VGISLSGGLDSRALLAAMPAEKHRPIHTVTFGVPGCDDIQIASQIAHVKSAVHHVVELTSANWLLKRMAGVWYTDGQANLLHMHALISVEEQRKNYRVNLNGFLGDAILGGSYLFDKRWTIAEKTVQRGRRFINEGTRLTNNFLHNRIPFFANPLMEFTCSIPESLRAHSKIYNEMLLAAFPAFFAKIPWQTTQLPISASRARVFAVSKLRGAMRRLAKFAPGLGLIGHATHSYHNYAVWIRHAPARSLFERMLLDPSARYRDFCQASDVPRLWSEHMKGRDHSEQLCRALTFELWLRQVNGRNFPPELLETEPSSSRFQPQPQRWALCELD
jgi:asparagine synthase (glutamine-hydrolysing)